MATARKRPSRGRKSVSRRDFLRVGSLSVVGLSVAEQAARARIHNSHQARSCIFLLMTGGASQFETFDPKPDAPAEIRGPLKSIPTSVPGIALSESLPQLAERAEKFALLRSLCHDAAPIHETGQQLLQTGRLASGAIRYPSFGSVVAHTLGARGGIAPYLVLPNQLSETGVASWQGQGGGLLGPEFDPTTPLQLDNGLLEPTETISESLAQLPSFDEPESVRRTYGETRFGELCLQARQLVECGVRCVTVNLFDKLNEEVTFDCHARAPWAPASLYDYRDTLCPQFDKALSALLDDLEDRGLLSETLVVAAGEFGRTPYVNEFGGRDHWPEVWSALVAGGDVRGGQIIGASDRTGSAPADRPIHPGELTSTIYKHLGLDLSMPLPVGGDQNLPLVEQAPLSELFA